MFFMFVKSGVEQAMSMISQQQDISQTHLDLVKGYVPKVQSAWIGKDAEEFAADVQRKVVPAFLELIAAFAGVNLNLTKSANMVDQADNQSKGLANQLGDLFGAI